MQVCSATERDGAAEWIWSDTTRYHGSDLLSTRAQEHLLWPSMGTGRWARLQPGAEREQPRSKIAQRRGPQFGALATHAAGPGPAVLRRSTQRRKKCPRVHLSVDWCTFQALCTCRTRKLPDFELQGHLAVNSHQRKPPRAPERGLVHVSSLMHMSNSKIARL